MECFLVWNKYKAAGRIKLRGHPVELRGHPVELRGYPVESRGRPVKSRGHPVKLRGYPVETRGRPVEARGRPVEARGRPVELRGCPVEARGRPVEARGRPVELRGRPVELRGCPLELRGRPVKARGYSRYFSLSNNKYPGMTEKEAAFVLGAQGNLWTEYVTSSKLAEYMIFPRICALAEAVWTPPENKNFEDFTRRLSAHKRRLDDMDILYCRH